ncbi:MULTISPECIES: LysR family transcriptional regulator [Ensifer]|uniref:LysR family transcriptional regulator n=1 Tax=Ensifer TaxID=106591 RepID=UPI0008E7AAA6|nr:MULTISPECIES: LysR family transcriptional regulator [Ensifer]QHG74704.1 LysR family transcriptional regulator [Ensifer adhaerens]SFH45799.1 DNA-binding transcriptional regulator, LysR family [Ensifer sp. OV372]
MHLVHKIDPKKLLYLATIIEHGSLKSAARALNVSQPALSGSMNRLESELGIRAFERTSKGVFPTPLGEILYCHARLIRDEIGLAERALLNAWGGAPAAVRLGSLPSLATSVMPLALQRWGQAHPDRELQIVESPQIDLLVGLLRREFDFVIGFTECYDLEEGLRQRVLFRDKLLVIARKGHPLAGQLDVDWRTLVSYPWVFPSARRPHAVLGAALRSTNISPPENVTVCGSVTLLKAVVANSDHLAVLPLHAVNEELDEGRLCNIPIDATALDRNIALYFREGYQMDEASRDLIAIVERVGQEICQRGLATRTSAVGAGGSGPAIRLHDPGEQDGQ